MTSKLLIVAVIVSQRGPTRRQHDLEKLIAMSSQASSHSQACSSLYDANYIGLHDQDYRRQETNSSAIQRLTITLFTRATLCIAQPLSSSGVCPSVCLSHAGIVSKRLNWS